MNETICKISQRTSQGVLIIPAPENGSSPQEIDVMSFEERAAWWERVKASGSMNSAEGRAMSSAVRKESDQLYERYAKSYEKDYYGKFVAIHPGGEMIIADKRYLVLEEMRERWGEIWCAFRRFGNLPMFEWKSARW